MWKIAIVVLALVVGSQSAALERSKRESPECPEDCTHAPMEISLVVDASRSVGDANFARLLTFLEEFVKMFQIAPNVVRMSMVTYGEHAYSHGAFGLSDYTNLHDLTSAIANTPYASGSATNTSDGIWYMLEHHYPEGRPNVRHIVMVITDGQSQNKRNTKKAAKDAQRKCKDVFAIGVGSDVSLPELHMIASDSRHVFMVTSYDMLVSIKKRLIYQACDVPTFPECEMDPVDLAFVIDSSLSIGRDNFTKGMDFVKDFVDSFQVDSEHVRIAALTYGDRVYTDDIFHFDTYKNKKEVLDRLNATVYHQGGATHTWEAIAEMRTNLMDKSRPGVPHVCIVITDGESQIPRKTKKEARLAKKDGIVMYAVGVGKVGETLNDEELRAIASGEENLMVVDDYQQLNVIKDRLINATCSDILKKVHRTMKQSEREFKQNLPRKNESP